MVGIELTLANNKLVFMELGQIMSDGDTRVAKQIFELTLRENRTHHVVGILLVWTRDLLAVSIESKRMVHLRGGLHPVKWELKKKHILICVSSTPSSHGIHDTKRIALRIYLHSLHHIS